MALLPRNFDLTDKDFDSLRARLFKLIGSVFPTWTAEDVANFGNILVELYAHVGDMLGFYLDNHALESRITTARLRRSLLALVKLIGYRPRGASASQVDETFTLAAAMAGTVTLPAGSKVLTAEVTAPIAFQLLADLVFAPGELVKSATVEHSETIAEAVASTGLANQVFELQRTPFIDGSAVVSAPNGDYTEVDNFLSSTSTDRHFTTTVDQNDRARITFGNDVNGAIPATGTIAITYKIGGGSSGIVEAGALSRLEQTFTDSHGTVARITVTNANRSSGGLDRASNAQIATYAPESLRVLGRCVSREDYEIAAKTVSGVARALHVTSNEYNVGENQGILFVVPEGGGVPSSTLLASVRALYTPTGAYPGENTYELDVQAAAYYPINIVATIYRASGVTKATAKARTLAALAAFFSLYTTTDQGETIPNPAIDFGCNMKDADGNPANAIAWSDVFNVVRDVVGVRKVDPSVNGLLLNGLRSDVAIGAAAFPTLGTVQLIDGDDGTEL